MATIKVLEMEGAMTKGGKPYKKLTVLADNETRKVNMWSNFPNFANIQPESVFEATMTKEGAYWNLSYDGAKSSPRGNMGATNTIFNNQIKVQEKISQNVGKAQEVTQLSVKMSSTINKAVELAIADKNDPTVLDTLEESVLKWRAFLWKHWDDPITNPIYPE